MSIRDDLKAFVDGELTPSREAEVRQAIDVDTSLQAEVIELRQMSRVVREESFQPEAVGMESTLLALAAASRKRSRPLFLKSRVLAGLAMAATLVLAVNIIPRLNVRSTMDDAGSVSAPKTETGSAPQAPEAVASPSASGGEGVAKRSRFGDQHGQDDGVEQGTISGVPPQYRRAKSQANTTLPARPSDQPVPMMQGEQISPRGDAEMKGRQPSAGGGLSKKPIPTLSRTVALVVHNSDLTIEVPVVSDAQARASRIASTLGGRVQSSGRASGDGATATAEVVIRVPVQMFERAMDQVRKLGRVVNESMAGEDVTAQVADTDARVRVLQAEEKQDVELMKKAKKLNETLEVRDRLTTVRQDIESLDAQRKVLREQAAMSSITVRFTQHAAAPATLKSKGWLELQWGDAWGTLGSIGRSLAGFGIYLFVFSPVWVPLAGLGWWFTRRMRFLYGS